LQERLGNKRLRRRVLRRRVSPLCRIVLRDAIILDYQTTGRIVSSVTAWRAYWLLISIASVAWIGYALTHRGGLTGLASEPLWRSIDGSP
jgi:hypothetical protein